MGDFNGDSDPDLAVANEGANTVSVLLGARRRDLLGADRLRRRRHAADRGVGDFNGDLDPDLAVVNEGSSNVSVLLGGTGASFTAPTNFSVGGLPRAIAVGDFNGDSDPDLAVANEATNNVSVLLGSAGGSFTGPTNFGVCSGPTAIAAGEFSGDSDPDIAAANELCHNVSVLAGRRRRQLYRAHQLPCREPSRRPCGRRVQRRFRPRHGGCEPELGQRVGADRGAGLGFVGPIDYPAGDGPSAVAVGDFNGDARPDLAVTNELVDNVSILLATANDGYPTAPERIAAQVVSLVPAYNACPPASANRTHGPPLENPSCNPPVQSSGFVTVGTSDANSNSPQSVGSVTYRVCLASPCGSGTAPDIKLLASINDVRNKSGLADYVGELQARVTLRITDRVERRHR